MIAPSNDSRKLQADIVGSVVATSSLDHRWHLRLMLLLTTCKLSLLLQSLLLVSDVPVEVPSRAHRTEGINWLLTLMTVPVKFDVCSQLHLTAMQTFASHNSPIYDEYQTQSVKVLALP